MAIGLALLVGIVLPVNFNSPYKAGSIIEFWRRWHMTLSAFLRDYLYIPLGGSRAGAPRRYANLMITMLLGGLWHGAAWTFVAWGGVHGVYLLVNHAWRGLRRPSPAPTRAARYASRLLTFACVVVAWVFFRAESMEAARAMIRSMAGLDGVSLPRSWMDPVVARFGTALPAWIGTGGMRTLGGWPQLAWLAAALGITWGLPNTQQIMARWPWLQAADPRANLPPARAGLLWEPSASWAAVTAVLACLGLLGLSRASAFIYFNF